MRLSKTGRAISCFASLGLAASLFTNAVGCGDTNDDAPISDEASAGSAGTKAASGKGGSGSSSGAGAGGRSNAGSGGKGVGGQAGSPNVGGSGGASAGAGGPGSSGTSASAGTRGTGASAGKGGTSASAGTGGTSASAGASGSGAGPGAGGSDARWDTDPCADPKLVPTPKAKLTINEAARTIHGTPGDDVIIGPPGGWKIYGGDGNDIICAGSGNDYVEGGAGADYIDGGDGQDRLHGGFGDDVIHGRGMGDVIFGDEGDDELYGDILDDELHGGQGNDLLVGGHGADFMYGDGGDDWLRGDTNSDEIHGGDGKNANGSDTASYMTAFPPGQPQGSAFGGVEIDFDKKVSSGDGFDPAFGGEPMTGIDAVVGSPFRDRFVRQTDVGKKRVFGGYGDDVFDLQGADVREPVGAEPAKPYVYVDNQPRDLGVVLMGGAGDDTFAVSVVGKAIRVTGAPGIELHAGPLCAHPDLGNVHIVDCAIPHTLRYVTGWGDKGNDVFSIGPGLPRDVTVHIDGGEGDDVISGSEEEDVFFTGRTGKDKLSGGAGDDALISESYDADKAANEVAKYGGGGDVLDAGSGNDQLVVDYPCGGHVYLCGGGRDVAGFARSGDRDITAQLGGPTKNKQAFHGWAYNPAVCGIMQGTRLHDGCEILEGSAGDDVLHGDDGDNIIWGRKGDDKITGNEGTDSLCGHEGADLIFAKEGERDRELAGETVFADALDPEKGLLPEGESFCIR